MSVTKQFFSRLDSADKQFAPYGVVAYQGVMEVKEEAAKNLMLDPLPLLAKEIQGVGDGWHVTINRVNAEQGFLWPAPAIGPHHLCVLALVLPEEKHVHCLVYRFPENRELKQTT
jgi:hypothetical protein